MAITVRSFWAVDGPTVDLMGPLFLREPKRKSGVNGAHMSNFGPTRMQPLKKKRKRSNGVGYFDGGTTSAQESNLAVARPLVVVVVSTVDHYK